MGLFVMRHLVIFICFHLFDLGIHDGILIGDSGYPCLPHLMTPYPNPTNPAQEAFNNALCRTRVKIEQLYGILKRRFPCLHQELRLTPARACETIGACAVLHNIAIGNNDLLDPEDLDLEDYIYVVNHGHETGTALRNYITNTYFS
jgi:hypothetical protein